MKPSQSGYAPINGLQLYYEIYGTGEPLLVLHGAFASMGMFYELIPALRQNRRVIAVDLQGHGRTADIERPLRYETMADDVAALLEYLEIEQADWFGYSMGAGVALQGALRHRQKVNRLIIASVTYNSNGYHPGMLEGISNISADDFAGSPMEQAYKETAPHPEQWAGVIEKVRVMDSEPQAWSEEAIRAIDAPALLIYGDADVITLEHAVALFRLLGGGVAGDMVGLPKAQLAVMPGGTHISYLFRTDALATILNAFLNPPTDATSAPTA